MSVFEVPPVSLPDYEKLLASLVAIPSVSSRAPGWDQSNAPVVKLMQTWFDTLGFQTEIMEVPGEEGKANLIATLGIGDQGLVLAGHTDTVPYDSSKWQSDPFKLRYSSGRLYGLGTCDMKGFFPIIIEALRQLEGARLRQPLVVLATADEESSMSGARAIAEANKLRGRAAVIGEPTSLVPVSMHKGIMMESIRVTGRSGHSSNPSLGNSAMEAMHEVVSELLLYRETMQKQFRNQAFEVSVPTLNLGRIHGGDSPNRICGHCELSFDLRPLPGMNTMALREELSELVNKIARKRQIAIDLSPMIETVEPFEAGKNSDLVSVCESMTSNGAEAVAFATEAPFLRALGLDTVVMGAGSIDQAHQPNEYLAVDQVTQMVSHLAGLIRHYCIQ